MRIGLASSAFAAEIRKYNINLSQRVTAENGDIIFCVIALGYWTAEVLLHM